MDVPCDATFKNVQQVTRLLFVTLTSYFLHFSRSIRSNQHNDQRHEQDLSMEA
jgi:hypothetical protein